LERTSTDSNIFEIYKEKEMADFRRWILALSVLALCVAGANAQVGTITGGTLGTGGSSLQQPFSCTSQSATVTPQLRAEGITELVGDIVLNCTGGADLTPNSQIPQANITVFLNTQVTSRLLASGNVSETVLMIDEPNSGLPGFGPAVPFSLCTSPSSGCPAWVGTGTVSATAIGNDNCSAAGCSQSGVAVIASGSSVPANNVYQGIVNPDGKSVTFYGVPILAPVSTGLTRVYRITNLRANATNIPAGASTPGYVQALISFNGSGFVPIVNSQTVVGYVNTSLSASIRNTSQSGGLSSSGTGLQQCNAPGSTGTAVGILRYASLFGTAFKTRVLASAGGGNGTNGSTVVQNVPGSPNNAVSESGLIFNGMPLANILGSSSSTQIGSGSTFSGLADYGTRFKAVFNNIPSGVSILVGTTNVVGASPVTSVVAPATTATNASYAQLIVSDSAPESILGGAPILTATGSNSFGNYVTLTPTAGTNTVTAVWEVVNSNTSTLQNFDFPVSVIYNSPSVANNIPTAPSVTTVSMSYAPISTTTSASSTATIPRFTDLGGGDNLTIFNIAICTTNLLFPYVTTITGFDTGLAISNTTMDPFGTKAQSGACTLYWYGNNTGGTTNTPIPNSTTATSGAPVINAGTTWTTAASASNMAGQGFTGYMIATCNFQYAHGYAAVTDIESRGILTAYLALVLNNFRGEGAAKETLSH